MNASRLAEIERIAKGRIAVVEGHGSLAVSERIILECVAEIKRLLTALARSSRAAGSNSRR